MFCVFYEGYNCLVYYSMVGPKKHMEGIRLPWFVATQFETTFSSYRGQYIPGCIAVEEVKLIN